jgi:hypothetical protein
LQNFSNLTVSRAAESLFASLLQDAFWLLLLLLQLFENTAEQYTICELSIILGF